MAYRELLADNRALACLNVFHLTWPVGNCLHFTGCHLIRFCPAITHTQRDTDPKQGPTAK